MPLKKGNTNIESVYLGTTPIGAIYKGTTLIYESFKWLPYSFTYLYHSLIPNVISNKTNKDLARVSKIYANGEIENQLVNANDTSKTLTSGHKYLTFLNGAYALTNGTGQSISVVGGTDMVIDITHQFGAGNEPTSLDDNRIKRIIAKGYIPYNTGTYKGTNIEAFESQPFNLLTYTPQRFITGSGQMAFDTSRATKLRANTSYMFRANNTFESSLGIRQFFAVFDLNGNRITDKTGFYFNGTLNSVQIYYQSGTGGFLTGSNNVSLNMTLKFTYDCYVMWGWLNANLVIDKPRIAIYNQDLLDYYAPHIASDTLSFKYQGNGAINAHDTMEITKTEYVFTKNVGVLDLGSKSWDKTTAFYTEVPDMKRQTPNGLTPLCPFSNQDQSPVVYDFIYSSLKSGGIPRIFFKYTRSSIYASMTAAQFKTAMAGVPLYYELATPQVIRIPRKHLGIYLVEQNMAIGETITLSNIASGTTNIYTKYGNIGTLNGTTITLTIAIESGTYIFYETQDEVANIDTEIVAQGGGTITSDSEVLPNVDFEFKCK